MATKRPSFLKRQKEQKRTARALAKREARRDRKQLKSTGMFSPDGAEPGAEETVEPDMAEQPGPEL